MTLLEIEIFSKERELKTHRTEGKSVAGLMI